MQWYTLIVSVNKRHKFGKENIRYIHNTVMQDIENIDNHNK